MQKTEILTAIRDALKSRLLVAEAAARASHTEATDESSKADNKYDTRGLEAGYLAQGQARQVRELAEAIARYEPLQLRTFAAADPIDLTALVELETGGVQASYFIGPTSGGLEVACAGGMVVVITPGSPLGQTLTGKKAGARWTAKIGGNAVAYRIVSVR